MIVAAFGFQACPYGFDTLACGKLDSCPFLGTQMVVLTHWEQTPNNSNSAISASSHLGYIQRAKNICLTLSKTAPVSPLDLGARRLPRSEGF
jgi:hypothetical protein